MVFSTLRRQSPPTLDFGRTGSLAFSMTEQRSWHPPCTLARSTNAFHPAIFSISPFRRSHPPARLGDRQTATSSITRDGNRSASHVSIASEQGLGRQHSHGSASFRRTISPNYRRCKVSFKDKSDEADSATFWPTSAMQNGIGMYSPSLKIPSIGGAWARMTARTTAACNPALQINRREGPERAFDSAGS